MLGRRVVSSESSGKGPPLNAAGTMATLYGYAGTRLEWVPVGVEGSLAAGVDDPPGDAGEGGVSDAGGRVTSSVLFGDAGMGDRPRLPSSLSDSFSSGEPRRGGVMSGVELVG